MAKTRGKSVTDGTQKKLRNLKPFKPGQSGNPKGRPKGARNRLGTQFLEALEADFNTHGAQAIAQVRRKSQRSTSRWWQTSCPRRQTSTLKLGRLSYSFGKRSAMVSGTSWRTTSMTIHLWSCTNDRALAALLA